MLLETAAMVLVRMAEEINIHKRASSAVPLEAVAQIAADIAGSVIGSSAAARMLQSMRIVVPALSPRVMRVMSPLSTGKNVIVVGIYSPGTS
jgi:hypothetical protein